MRDKSHIKLVKPRPANLIPTWERKPKSSTTRYEDFDIDCHLSALNTISDTSISDAENAQPEVASQEVDTSNVPNISSASEPLESDTANEEEFFSESDLSNRMAHLLQNIGISLENDTSSSADLNTATADNSSEEKAEQAIKSEYQLRKSCKLAWNPEMNKGPAVVSADMIDEN